MKSTLEPHTVVRTNRQRRDSEVPLRYIDFSSWQSLLATVVGLALFALIGIGIRLLMMFTIQQRRERMNRQINERLRALISAYKVLGGSFTGDLTVNPAHLRDLHYSPSPSDLPAESAVTESRAPATGSAARSDRPRRIRDSVEAALSDIFLLGTEEHVRLAERAARELTAGRPVHTHELVVSLRNFIREALDLDPIPPDLAIPIQGPARPSNSAGRGKGERASETSRQGAGGRGGGMGMGGGMGAGLGVGGDENQAPTDHHS